MRRFRGPILGVLLAASGAAPGGPPLALGETRTLHSAVLNEDREYQVHLPPSYRLESDRRYPVLYVLDGRTHFGHTSASVDFLAAEGEIPETIVVAVTSTVRVRDFTQTDWPKAWVGGGGAGNFKRFLSAELIPAVEGAYRTDGFRILSGHSAGGQFALYVLSSEPALFRAYFALSPSLDWDDRLPARSLKKSLESTGRLDAFLYVARSDDSGQALADWNGLLAALDSKKVARFRWQSEAFLEERHRTIPLVGGIHALRALWVGYRLPEGLEARGLAAVDEHYATLSRTLGWPVPVPGEALNSLGYAELEKGHVDEAVAIFTRYTKEHPASSSAFDGLADAYEKAGRWQDAARAAHKSVEVAPADDPNLAYYRRHASKLDDRLKEESAAPRLAVREDPELRARLERVRGAHGVPGMGAAVLRDERVMIAVAGKRRVDRDAPLASTDAFHLGSDTKGMTASLVARLVDRRMLRWDETLGEALPRIAAKMDPVFKTVTLDMLMRHVAGLPTGGAFTPEFTAGFDDEHWPIAKQRAWMAERFLSRPPNGTPGTRFAYSNYGYLILGAVVEHATGKTWEELIRKEVFEPLTMTRCGFGPTAISARPDGNWAHDVKDGAYVPTAEDNPPLIGPAGTIHCPLVDWARFAAAHAGTGPAGWLTPDSLAHLHEGVTLTGVESGKDIAFGWGVTRTDPPRLTHSGSNGYNDAEIVVIPRLHAAVLVTCNAGDERARDAAKEVLDALVEELLTPGRAARPAPSR